MRATGGALYCYDAIERSSLTEGSLGTQVYRLSKNTKSLSLLGKRHMSDLNFYEVSDLEAWLASCKDKLFDRSILWIARQDWPSDAQRSDIVGISDNGDLVIVELKRGRATEAAITQVIGYASDYQPMTPQDLANVYYDHSQKSGKITLLDPAKTLEDAESRIGAHVGELNEVNKSQILIIFAELFEDRTLSICDYLSRSVGEAAFTIELWQFGIHPIQDEKNMNDHLFVVEQILPPPSIRAQVKAEREAAKTRRYARDPKRIEFMKSLIDYLQKHNCSIYRSPGESYSAKIEVDGNEITLQVYRGDDHPWMTLPNEIQLDAQIDAKLKLRRGSDDVEEGYWWLEFKGVDANNLKFTEEFGDSLIQILQKLCATEST